MSGFDKDLFLSTGTEESMSVEYVVVPVGEYTGIIEKIDARKLEARDGKPEAFLLDITWIVDDQAVKDETGMDKPIVRQSLMLDIANGMLQTGKGKNVQLGRLREALGQNRPGAPWSPSMLLGQVAKINVSNREHEGKTYADVKGVAPLQ